MVKGGMLERVKLISRVGMLECGEDEDKGA